MSNGCFIAAQRDNYAAAMLVYDEVWRHLPFDNHLNQDHYTYIPEYTSESEFGHTKSGEPVSTKSLEFFVNDASSQAYFSFTDAIMPGVDLREADPNRFHFSTSVYVPQIKPLTKELLDGIVDNLRELRRPGNDEPDKQKRYDEARALIKQWAKLAVKIGEPQRDVTKPITEPVILDKNSAQAKAGP